MSGHRWLATDLHDRRWRCCDYCGLRVDVADEVKRVSQCPVATRNAAYRALAGTVLAESFSPDDVFLSEEADVERIQESDGAWVQVRIWVRDEDLPEDTP